jgi:hypothetical protein
MPSIPAMRAGTQRPVALPSFGQTCGRVANLRPGGSRHETPPLVRGPLRDAGKTLVLRGTAHDRVSGPSGRPGRVRVTVARSTRPLAAEAAASNVTPVISWS